MNQLKVERRFVPIEKVKAEELSNAFWRILVGGAISATSIKQKMSLKKENYNG